MSSSSLRNILDFLVVVDIPWTVTFSLYEACLPYNVKLGHLAKYYAIKMMKSRVVIRKTQKRHFNLT